MIPVLLNIGPLPVYSFGLMMVLGFLGAWSLLYKILEAHGEPTELAEKLVFWCALGGVFGARIGYILSFPELFFQDPIAAVFSSAGFVFLSGFIGGVLSFCWVVYTSNVSFLRYADFCAPCLMVGYAIGRVGCQLSGDGDYGIASTVPWAMSYGLGVVPTPIGVNVHPTPVYETIFALCAAVVLYQLLKTKKLTGEGKVFGVYLLLSGISRFLVEFIRVEPVVLFNLTQAQVVSVLLVLIGSLLLSIKSKSIAT